LPESLSHPLRWTMIASRFWSVAALFGALLPHGPIVGRRALLLVAVAVLAAWYPLRLGRAWARFDRRAASLRLVLAQLPRGSSTLTVRLGRQADPDLPATPDLWDHAHAWPQLVAGGVDPFGPANGVPLQALVPPLPLPQPAAVAPSLEQLAPFDYLLTQSEPHAYSLFGPDGAQVCSVVAEVGDWRLYKLRKGEP